MASQTDSSSKTVAQLVFLLSVRNYNCQLTVLVQMTSRVEMLSIGPVNFWITVHLPDIGDDGGIFGNKVAFVPIVLNIAYVSAPVLLDQEKDRPLLIDEELQQDPMREKLSRNILMVTSKKRD